MIKNLQLVFFYLFTSSIAISQSNEKPWAIGVEGDLLQYNGEFGNQLFSTAGNVGYGLTGTRYLTPSWDAMLVGSYGIVKGVNNNDYFKAKGVNLALLAKLKMNNGKILKASSIIKPYLVAGIGDYFGSVRDVEYNQDRLISPFFTGGAGLEFPIYKALSLDTRLRYDYLWTDKIDNDITETIINDQLLHVTVGLKYTFSSVKDTDQDGVIDRKDECPEIPGLEIFNGCPDTDNDGVRDQEDNCPNIAGLVNLKGCPDTDKDGITDSKDACPTIAGLAEFDGCPDTDGDGIKDSEDRCPKTAGSLNGCPDQDNDGVSDKDDACPTIVGKINGCPDSDNDGIIDSKDKCPNTAGITGNDGCPEVKVAEVIIPTFEPVYFDFNSALLSATAKKELDKVVTSLKADSSLTVSIIGHSDNVGNPTTNQTLSNQRALTVQNYLIQQKISTVRISTLGVGETKPIGSNDTPEGRAKNRRAEIIISK